MEHYQEVMIALSESFMILFIYSIIQEMCNKNSWIELNFIIKVHMCRYESQAYNMH